MRVLGMAIASVLVLVGCSGSEDPEPTPTGSTEVKAASISVSVSLPDDTETLLGPATGRVVNERGEDVAPLRFASGWVVPPDWNLEGTVPRSDAPTAQAVELPSPGTYTFELDPFGTSGAPCGTCGQGYTGGVVSADVVDGSSVQLPAGELSAVS